MDGWMVPLLFEDIKIIVDSIVQIATVMVTLALALAH